MGPVRVEQRFDLLDRLAKMVDQFDAILTDMANFQIVHDVVQRFERKIERRRPGRSRIVGSVLRRQAV